MTHLISETALIAAEDAYDEIATNSYEQINRSALEKAIKAYLATDPVIVAHVGLKDRIEAYARLDDEDKRSEEPEDRAYHTGRAAGLRMAAGLLK